MSREGPGLPKQRAPCDLPSTKSSASFWHKEPSALLTGHRSTRNLPEKADVVIIGSGMTGTSIAHNLLNGPDGNEKLSVVLLEAREACWGATGRNGGHCQPILFEHPHDPSIGHFELKNFHTLQKLIDDKGIDCEFVAQPGVRAIYSRGHLNEVELALHTVNETAPELASMMRLVTDKDELNSFRIPTALGAVVTSIAARMWPYKFVSRILEDLLTSTNLNGSFNLQTLTPVTKIQQHESSNTVTLETNRDSITAKKIILATNAYTSHLLPKFTDLIVPCRGQMSALIPFPSIAGADRLQTSLGFMGDGLDDYLIQRPNATGGHLMFGGGRQHSRSLGVTDDSFVDEKTAHYLRGRLVEALNLPEGDSRKSLDATRCDSCMDRNVKCPPRQSSYKPCKNCEALNEPCSAMSSWTEMDATHIWTGIMGFSRDEKPWVGAVPEVENVFLAAGFTGHGMPNTWLSGKAVAMLVASSLKGEDDGKALERATVETGLPKSYVATKERMQDAMLLEDVETKDWAEMERGRYATRPASGYA